jgi:hypothetical protein
VAAGGSAVGVLALLPASGCACSRQLRCTLVLRQRKAAAARVQGAMESRLPQGEPMTIVDSCGPSWQLWLETAVTTSTHAPFINGCCINALWSKLL